MTNAEPKIPDRFNPWLSLILSAVAVLGALWAALMWFNPIGKVDVTIQIKQETPVSLPADIAALPVQLVYEGQPIARASIVQVEIINSGKTEIGERENTWKLDLRNPDGVKLVALGAPKPNPSNMVVAVESGTAPDVVSLDIGLFNAGDSILLDLMLVEPKESLAYPIKGETRVPGLSAPVTIRGNVEQRLKDAFVLPLWAVGFLALLGVLFWERVKFKQLGVKTGLAHTIVGGAVLALVASAALATGGAWAIAWFAANVLAR
jgi:hypothetical protein